MKFTQLTLVAFAVLLFSSCTKDESSDFPEITYNIKTSNRTNANFTWISGSANGKQIEFKGNAGGSNVEEYVLAFENIDLFSNTGARISSLTVPPGTYSNVEMNFEMLASRNPSLILRGNVTNNGVTTPITLNMENWLEISTRKESVTLESGKKYNATIDLNLAAMMNGVTQTMLTNATRTNGEILVAYHTNLPIYTTIINNINNVMTHSLEFSE